MNVSVSGNNLITDYRKGRKRKRVNSSPIFAVCNNNLSTGGGILQERVIASVKCVLKSKNFDGVINVMASKHRGLSKDNPIYTVMISSSQTNKNLNLMGIVQRSLVQKLNNIDIGPNQGIHVCIANELGDDFYIPFIRKYLPQYLSSEKASSKIRKELTELVIGELNEPFSERNKHLKATLKFIGLNAGASIEDVKKRLFPILQVVFSKTKGGTELISGADREQIKQGILKMSFEEQRSLALYFFGLINMNPKCAEKSAVDALSKIEVHPDTPLKIVFSNAFISLGKSIPPCLTCQSMFGVFNLNKQQEINRDLEFVQQYRNFSLGGFDKEKKENKQTSCNVSTDSPQKMSGRSPVRPLRKNTRRSLGPKKRLNVGGSLK